MNLFRRNNEFWYWTARVIRRFLQVRPGATVLVIAFKGIANVSRVVAFLLPLKVILLAGSPGVPRYFPFIAPEQKNLWIMGLASGAFLAYGMTLILEGAAERWSRDAGRDILRRANQMSLDAREGDQIKIAFRDFSGVVAAAVFVSLSALLLVWLNPTLLAFLVVAVGVQFSFTAWALSDDQLPAPAMKAWIEGFTGQYLAVLLSLIFLCGFLVILAPFVTGAGGNILLALVGIILLRQLLNSLKEMVADGIRLLKQRNRIDALVFRSSKLQNEQKGVLSPEFYHLFDKERRQHRNRLELAQVTQLQGNLKVSWADSAIAGVKTLNLIEHDAQDQPLHRFQQQIFSPSHAHLFENEGVLFKYVSRERLKAPKVFASFDEGDFRCQICAHGDGTPVPAKDWPQVRDSLLHPIWSYRPSEALVRSYRGSRPLLHERLTHTFCKRIEIAVDTPEEAELVARWQEELTSIQEMLRRQPRAIHNPDFNRMNVVRAGDAHLVMAWGRWTLEPLGGAILLAGVWDKGGAHLDAVRVLRPDLSGRTWESDLQLGGWCQQLEGQINREQYRAALGTMKALLTGYHQRMQGAESP